MLRLDQNFPWWYLAATALVALWPLVIRSARKRFWLLSLVPVLWLVIVYGFVLRARLALGYWPSPYLPDPKDLGFNWHYSAIWVGIPAIIASAIWLVALVLVQFRQHLRSARYRLGVAFYTVTFATWWGVWLLDPGRFFYWLAD